PAVHNPAQGFSPTLGIRRPAALVDAEHAAPIPGAVPCLSGIDLRRTMPQGNSRATGALCQSTSSTRSRWVNHPKNPVFHPSRETQAVTTKAPFALFAHASADETPAPPHWRSQMRVEARKGSKQGES